MDMKILILFIKYKLFILEKYVMMYSFMKIGTTSCQTKRLNPSYIFLLNFVYKCKSFAKVRLNGKKSYKKFKNK